jgi:hypothetical protein
MGTDIVVIGGGITGLTLQTHRRFSLDSFSAKED